jgi:hypothetical protein
MRAKIVLAAALLVSALQPAFSQDLVRDVHETLLRPTSYGAFSRLLGMRVGSAPLLGACGVMTRSAVIAPACPAASCAVETQPAVLAPAGACTTAILTRDPSDLDIRREQLEQKIACLSASLNACDLQAIKASMLEIDQAELAMRNDGCLDTLESRRLYKAMDRLASHLDRWTTGGGFGSLIGLRGGLWY